MPARDPLPTVQELVTAFDAGVGSEREVADAHTGSIYDHLGGPAALIFRRVSEHHQEEFRAIYFDAARGSRLDTYVEDHFKRDRTLNEPGIGVAHVHRLASGNGRFLARTRIAVAPLGAAPTRYWEVSEDTDVGTALSAQVPIVATDPGDAGQISAQQVDVARLYFADLNEDATWIVDAIDCAAGTVREEDDELRADIRQERIDERVGYEAEIVSAMKAAGAAFVVLFESDFLGEDTDFGLNRIYVADQSWQSPAALLRGCRLAVPSSGIAGTSLQVLAVASQLLYLRISVRLWSATSRLNATTASTNAALSVVEYFAKRENVFVWRSSAIRSAIMKVVPNVHGIDIAAFSDPAFTVPVAEPVLASLFSADPLVRYLAETWAVRVSVAGPS